MNKIIIVLLMAITAQSYGQSFEGTITWSASDPTGKGAPSSIILKVKGTTIATTINGGMMNGMEMWFMDNDTKMMRVMRAQKMFVVVPPEAMAAAAKATETTKFVKSTETAKILNYNCTKYTGEMTSRGVATKVAIWTTNEIKDDLKVLAHLPDPFGNPKLPEGVEGVPLKIEKTDAKGTAAMQVTEVKLEKLGDDIFKLPADFKEMGK